MHTRSKPDWWFNTQSSVLQADRLILENTEKATLHDMPYYVGSRGKNLDCKIIIIYTLLGIDAPEGANETLFTE